MAKVLDAGEQLIANRRNSREPLTIEEAFNMNPTLRASSVTKEKVWPKPDYAKLIEAGMKPFAARALKSYYDAIASKPRSVSDESIHTYINTLSRARDRLTAWFSNPANIAAAAKNTLGRIQDLSATEASLASGKAIDISTLIPNFNGSEATFTNAFLLLVWPDEMTLPSRERFRRGSSCIPEVAELGGNRLFSKVQLDSKALATISKDIADGWPLKRPAWQVQGIKVLSSPPVVAERVGKNDARICLSIAINERTHAYIGLYETMDEALSAKASLKEHIVLDRNNRLIGSFESSEQAIACAEDRTKSTKASTWSPEPIPVQQLQRKGPETPRHGRDVTSDSVLAVAGLRGLNFGNWVPNNERQLILNACHDSLLDLSTVLGVESTSLGMSGRLGLAIGAQGKGGNAAGHFIPGIDEINSTRFSGGSILSHEYGHFLDHSLAKLISDARGNGAFATVLVNGRNDRILNQMLDQHPSQRPIFEALRKVMKEISNRPLTFDEAATRSRSYESSARSRAARILVEMGVPSPNESSSAPEELIAISGALLRDGLSLESKRMEIPGRGYGKKYPVSGQIAELIRCLQSAGKATPPASDVVDLESALVTVFNYKEGGPRFPAPGEPSYGEAHSAYFQNSVAMDSEKGGERYWSTEPELFARAFSSWVRVALDRVGIQNDHLSSDDRKMYEAAQEMGLVKSNPFLCGDELTRVCRAMDELVALLPMPKVTQKVDATASKANKSELPPASAEAPRQHPVQMTLC